MLERHANCPVSSPSRIARRLVVHESFPVNAVIRFRAVSDRHASLDPVDYFLLVVEKHLVQTSLGGPQEATVSLGRLAAVLHVAPDAVRVGNVDE